MRWSRKSVLLVIAASTATITFLACNSDSSTERADDASAPAARTPEDRSVAIDAGPQADTNVPDGGGAADGSDASDASEPCTACVTQIAVGYQHVCALLTDKTVRCWGSNRTGTLGSGADSGVDGGFDDIEKAKPVAVPGLTDVALITAGIFHTCALKSDGTVWCWGLNSSLQLGQPEAAAAVHPVPLQVHFNGGTIVELEAGGYRTCVRYSAGTVECVGDNGEGQLGGGKAVQPNVPSSLSTPIAMVGISNATDLAIGLRHSCVAVADGGVSCVGRNLDGELGRGAAGRPDSTPMEIGLASGAARLGTMSGNHACAILVGGELQCWGYNEHGQIAPEAGVIAASPFTVSGISGVVEVSGGYYTTCARVAGGDVYCWGGNAKGQAGREPGRNLPTPSAVVGLEHVVQIATSYDAFTCALVESGKVYCWGDNSYGRLGREQDASALSFDWTPKLVQF